ncbi:DUF4367 domain-containing protein [Priestia taiwanensis]|uniref:DUF4367 domain-containing protein n=1 Tax=Priestia taiwanensis TaxID=1347902 RepID=A0A917EQS4_9BACI|nr:DUF4367 domain-containing protein [Priestia taiwanensis]MBM7363774.1 hypothetical protein [Priestia taiwanensis]GGE74205.1 hypothetical protein GCM10007140_25120 [Priestia taiwanensis]
MRLLMLLFCWCLLAIPAQAITYHKDSITIEEVEKRVAFSVFKPKNLPKEWELVIKTSPDIPKENVNDFRLQYFEKNDEISILVISQQDASSVIHDYQSPSAKRITINGNEGYFSEWINSGEFDKNGRFITGGVLDWIQDGTYIEMYSDFLTKEQMLDIARSMKE